jgi:hypothetical protein
MEEFVFHMTLTDALEPELRQRVLALLEPMTAPVCAEPLIIDALSLFHQPDQDAPFRLIARLPFGGAGGAG